MWSEGLSITLQEEQAGKNLPAWLIFFTIPNMQVLPSTSVELAIKNMGRKPNSSLGKTATHTSSGWWPGDYYSISLEQQKMLDSKQVKSLSKSLL